MFTTHGLHWHHTEQQEHGKETIHVYSDCKIGQVTSAKSLYKAASYKK